MLPCLLFAFCNLTKVFLLQLGLSFFFLLKVSNFSELSLKEHLLSKDTNYTITFSMSAVRHCAEAMFLIVFVNSTCIFLLPFFICQQIIECAAVKFEPEKKELLASSGVGRFFVYTQSSSTEHYLGLEGS